MSKFPKNKLTKSAYNSSYYRDVISPKRRRERAEKENVPNILPIGMPLSSNESFEEILESHSEPEFEGPFTQFESESGAGPSTQEYESGAGMDGPSTQESESEQEDMAPIHESESEDSFDESSEKIAFSVLRFKLDCPWVVVRQSFGGLCHSFI